MDNEIENLEIRSVKIRNMLDNAPPLLVSYGTIIVVAITVGVIVAFIMLSDMARLL